MELRVHRIPWSTNVERVAIAAAHKGVRLTYADHDPEDRSALRALSGQELVPVVEFPDGEVVSDSPAILRRLEQLVPEPPLWPHDPARRAEVDVFVEWFNRVWKVPPNAIEAELRRHKPDAERIAAWARELRGWLPLFESLLTGRAFLFGDTLSIADVISYPFLRYGVVHDPADDEVFHRVLVEEMPLGTEYPLLTQWVLTLEKHPRA